MNIEYTCIKEKAKGVYKNTSPNVVTEEKPEETTISSLDFETDIENFNLESWIKVVRSNYQNLHVIKEKSVNDKYLVWHCAKSQLDKKTGFIWGVTPIHIYCYPNLTFGESFTGTFYDCFELFDKQKQSDTVNFDSIVRDSNFDRDSSELNQDTSEHLDAQEINENDTNSFNRNYFDINGDLCANINDHTSEHLNFDSIVREVKTDIAKQVFFEKIEYYLDLLKVSRQEFDDYLICEFSLEEMKEMIDTGEDELLWETEVKVNEVKVFDRLFALYCPDTGFVIPPKTNLHLREWRDHEVALRGRLEKDGRYFPKKQLNLFGED
jgi:hypothetical protein